MNKRDREYKKDLEKLARYKEKTDRATQFSGKQLERKRKCICEYTLDEYDHDTCTPFWSIVKCKVHNIWRKFYDPENAEF